jgi:hypothetical protein
VQVGDLDFARERPMVLLDDLVLRRRDERR